MSFWKAQKGSTATEYMLVLSVVVIAVAAAGYVYVPGFHAGTDALSHDVSRILATHDLSGVGMSAPTSGGAPDAAAPPPPIPIASIPTQCVGATCTGRVAGVGGGFSDEGAASTSLAGIGSAVVVGGATGAGVDPATVAAARTGAGSLGGAVANVKIYLQASMTCSQYAISQATGQNTYQVVTDTIKNGFTVPDTKTEVHSVGFRLFGSHFSFFNSTTKKPADYQGYMSLGGMHDYMAAQGVSSTKFENVNMTQVQQTLDNHHGVIAVIDVNNQGEPAQGCGGHCGHTVTVLEVDSAKEMVRISDPIGERWVHQNAFEAALAEQKGGMLDVTPRGQEPVASSRR